MASTYSPTLRIELIGDGDQSGIWGQTTNTNLGSLIEQAITGVVTIVMTDANYTLTAYNGVVDESRNNVLVVTGTNSAQRNIIAPLVEKTYIIKNSTTGGYGIQIIGATGTGVVIPNGMTAAVFCDGNNFYQAGTGSPSSFTVNNNLSVGGNSSITGNELVGGNSSITGNLTVGGDIILSGDLSVNDFAYTGTLTGGTGVVNIGSGQFYKDSSGNIGVGTTSPGVKLDVYSTIRATGSASPTIYTRSTGLIDAVMGSSDSSSVGYFGTASNTATAFLTNNTERVRIDTSGNVGIGTTAPLSKLSIRGLTGYNLLLGAIGTNSTIYATDNAGTTAVDLLVNANNIKLSTLGVERLRVDTSGNVGIGTSSPTARLNVVSTTTATNALKITDGTNYTLLSGYTANSVGYFGGDTGTALALYTNGAERMRISTSGDVGIGTSSPTAMLTVAGNISLAPVAGSGVEGSQIDFAGGSSYSSYNKSIDIFNADMRIFGANNWNLSVLSTTGTANFVCQGNVTAYSDARLKSDVKTITHALDIVDELRGVSFIKDGQAGIGVIAQEVQRVLPQVVLEGEEYLSVAYGNIVGVLIEAIKELRAEVKALRGE